MATPRSQGGPDVPPRFAPDIASFRRHLRSENKSDNTVRIYTDAAERFAKFLDGGGGAEDLDPPADWADVQAADVQAWMVSLLDTRAAGYANNQYRSIQQFFRWWSDEEQAPNPMAGLKPPMVPEQPIEVLTKEQLGALLRDCQGRDFVNRRDLAILYMLMDAGVRRAEVIMNLEDVDLDMREARVQGKGRRARTVTYGKKAAVALDRYLRERARQKWADSPKLWLAEKNRGTLGTTGIYLMLKRRGARAGVPELHPHMLRHSWAHYLKVAGESEENLMRLAGWRSRQMLDRYGASAADERARESSKRRALGDQL